MLQFTPSLLEAVFIKRLSRFSARILLAGKEQLAHVPNSGRMRELLLEGAKVYVQSRDLPHRITKYDLVAVEYQGILVSIDSRIPNKIMPMIISTGMMEEMGTVEQYRGEVKLGHSRLDYWAKTTDHEWYIETKSVTLVEDGEARFPDAPTERGSRHLLELAQWVKLGGKAAAVFIIQREDARYFRPNDETDPIFGQNLRQVASEGVLIKAYTCRVSQGGVSLSGEIPVQL